MTSRRTAIKRAAAAGQPYSTHRAEAPGKPGKVLKRGKTEAQKQAIREQNKRVQTADKLTRAQRDALNKRIATEQAELAQRLLEQEDQRKYEVQAAAKAARVEKLRRRTTAVRAAAHKRSRWTLGQARALVRDGYTPTYVERRTGWSAAETEDAYETMRGDLFRPV